MRNHTGSIFNMTCISDGSGGLPTEISLPFATIFAVIALAGVTGNILVILSICLCGKMRTAMNFVLVNMAIADVGNLLSCAPEIIQILFSRSWLFPNFFCPTIRYLQIGFLYSSVGFQIAVSLERYEIFDKDTSTIIAALIGAL